MNLGSVAAVLMGLGISIDLIDRFLKRQSATVDPKKVEEEFKSVVQPKMKIHTIKNLEGRIKHIRGVIHRALREEDGFTRRAALGMVRHAPERDYLAELRSIYQNVRKRVRYRRDIMNVDTYQSPRRTLELGGGDCDDYSILLAALYLAIGYPVKLKVIRTKTASDWNHIYIVVGLPQRKPVKWIPIDGSVAAFVGWEAPKRIVAESKTFDV